MSNNPEANINDTLKYQNKKLEQIAFGLQQIVLELNYANKIAVHVAREGHGKNIPHDMYDMHEEEIETMSEWCQGRFVGDPGFDLYPISED